MSAFAKVSEHGIGGAVLEVLRLPDRIAVKFTPRGSSYPALAEITLEDWLQFTRDLVTDTAKQARVEIAARIAADKSLA